MSMTRNAETFNPAETWDRFLQASWAAFAAKLFADDMPPKQWEFLVAAYLFERGYHVDSVRAVLEYTAAWGTAEGCRGLSFDAADCARVERLLPGVPDYQWARLDDYVWETGGDGRGIA